MPAAALSTAAICSVAELGDEARMLMREDQAPREFLDLLVEKAQFADAARFLAHALPKREAVWWAWYCARRAVGPEPAPNIKAALDATEKWISEPTDDHGRAARQAAEAAKIGTGAGCAGLAAFFSGDSLAPPDKPAVKPGPYLTAKAVSGAIIFSAVSAEPEKAPDKFRLFLQQGMEVARRVGLW